MSQTADLALATRPGNADAVPRIIEEINALQGHLKDGGEAIRHELVIKARSLVQALQTPREQMLQHNWADVCNYYLTLELACS
ncbi:hypothetical protein IMZ48_18620 [Candidatus Bathyarchaeota archaeon]|nr:hypothetical protein [Candidatus Bathyarchaeota archaeon]